MVAGLELLVLDQLVLLGQLVHTLMVLQLPLPLQVSSYPHGEQVSINSIIYFYRLCLLPSSSRPRSVRDRSYIL